MERFSLYWEEQTEYIDDAVNLQGFAVFRIVLITQATPLQSVQPVLVAVQSNLNQQIVVHESPGHILLL